MNDVSNSNAVGVPSAAAVPLVVPGKQAVGDYAPGLESAEQLQAKVAAVMERRRRSEAEVKQAKIMIVDDEEHSLFVFRRYLQDAGYENLVSLSDVSLILQRLIDDKPDLLLLDLTIPQVSVVDLLANITCLPGFEKLPIIALTSSCDCGQREVALSLGVLDFLAKPVDRCELVPRVRNALVSRSYQVRLSQYAAGLESTIRKRTNDLEASRREVVYCLARAAEFRDDITGRHVIRVGKYVGVLARRLGFSPKDVDLLEMAAQLHDIGKIGIPDNILKKSGQLTEAEYRLMKKHSAMGLHILRPIKNQTKETVDKLPAANPPTSPLLALAGRIAATHHEKWDGTGYPLGLIGEQIPIEGRLTAVADVFDSLSSVRPYKPAFPLEKCFQILREGIGKHFDPQIIEHFFAAQDEILELRREFHDPDED